MGPQIREIVSEGPKIMSSFMISEENIRLTQRKSYAFKGNSAIIIYSTLSSDVVLHHTTEIYRRFGEATVKFLLSYTTSVSTVTGYEMDD